MQPASVHVFDLDGVVTHVHDSSVDDEAVGYIRVLLDGGAYVAINTGRAYAWVRQHILRRLELRGGKQAFDHLFIACEKGGESVEWREGAFRPQPSRFSLDEAARQRVHALFMEHRAQLGTMFWDEAKTTMATLEKRPEAGFEQFASEQQLIAAKLQEVFAGQSVRVDTPTLAVDIESSAAGKHAGAELIYGWIRRQVGATPLEFISLGDSRSDYEMARYFAQQGCGSTFIFVGGETDAFTEEPGVNLIRTEATYAAGTHEYFAKAP